MIAYEEARRRLEGCRQRDERDPFPILTCMKRVVATATDEDRSVLNEVIREWLMSGDEKERFDGAWLTAELGLVMNLDLIRMLRDEAETRDDPAAPYDWQKFDRIAGHLVSISDCS